MKYKPRFPRFTTTPGTKGLLNKKTVGCCCCSSGIAVAIMVVVAVVPLYTKPQTTKVNINETNFTLIVAYTSDAANARSVNLTDFNSLALQIAKLSQLERVDIKLKSAQFYAQVENQAARSCEQPSSLEGDIFVAEYVIQYLPSCISIRCREQFIARVENKLRMGNEVVTVQMTFTTAEVRDVQLLFCGFFTDEPGSDCTTETRNYIYLLQDYGNLYRFNPITYQIDQITEFNCTQDWIWSIAVQRNGSLWVFAFDGLYQYDLRTSQCLLIFQYDYWNSYVFSDYYFPSGMTFVKSSSSNVEILYAISGWYDYSMALFTLDWNTYNFTLVSGSNQSRGYTYDLAGTQTGRLFGLNDMIYNSSEIHYRLADINPINGQINSAYQIGGAMYNGTGFNTSWWYNYYYGVPYWNNTYTNNSTGNGTNYYYNETGFYDTLASYQNNFFFFSWEYEQGTGVYLFDTSKNSTTRVLTAPDYILKATSSSCLGT